MKDIEENKHVGLKGSCFRPLYKDQSSCRPDSNNNAPVCSNISYMTMERGVFHDISMTFKPVQICFDPLCCLYNT